MVRYRRNWLPGGSFFFTVTLANRHSRALTDHVEKLRQAFRAVRNKQPFSTIAIVVLPEHLHAIWSLPEGDTDYPRRWQAIKAHFTRALRTQGVSLSSDGHGGYRLWARRY